MAGKFLVIPTNRPNNLLRFFDEWGGDRGKGGWDAVIVVEDGPSGTVGQRCSGLSAYNFCWESIDRLAGDASWIFSRKDSAIRAFGFLAAWHLGAEHVLTLDDDCYPVDGMEGTLFENHLKHSEHELWASPISGGFRTRGMPYRNTGEVNSDVNVGLWVGNPDVDAIMQLSSGGTYSLPNASCMVPASFLIPMSGMNLCVTRRALPLMYYPLMGEGQPFSRFDDIWCGVIAKKLMDRLGWHMSVGPPHVKHVRASDPLANLKKEAPGIAANETFWEFIWGLQLDGDSEDSLMQELGHDIERFAGEGANEHLPADYLVKLGKALQVWAGLFKEGALKF